MERLVRRLVAATALLLVVGVSGSAGAASYSPSSYQAAGSGFQDQGGNIMTWNEATISIPPEPTWTAPGQEVSGWLLGTAPGVVGSQNWNQVGWVNYGTGAPLLYTETNDQGNDSVSTFATLAWGSSVNVAISCDTGTGIWQDFWQPPGTTGWTIINTQWTYVDCNTAEMEWADERYSNGAATFPQVAPESITNLFSDVTGDEYYPTSTTQTSWDS